jgi:ABC-type polysaccharide/polyol phosphate transport system ATPase subunit
MSSEPFLDLHNVWKKYSPDAIFHRSIREDMVRMFRNSGGERLHGNEFWALREVGFSVRRGEAIGLYGHNGAGKSTILKMLAGITSPTLGTLKVQGRVAPLIEIGAGFHPDLTGRENVMMNGVILGMKISEIKNRFDAIVEFSGLGSFIEMPVKKYSSGMYLRLAFSIAIHSEADIYLIDEIIAVGDREFQEKCLNRVRMAKADGKTLVVVSHDLDLLNSIVDSVVFLEQGAIQKICTI